MPPRTVSPQGIHTRTRVLDALEAAGPAGLPSKQVAALTGLVYRTVWETMRRLHAEGLVSPSAPPAKDRSRGYPPSVWRLGSGVPWVPPTNHRSVLSRLPACETERISTEQAAAATGLHPRSVGVMLVDLHAAGLAEPRVHRPRSESAQVDRPHNLWQRTALGDKKLREYATKGIWPT